MSGFGSERRTSCSRRSREALGVERSEASGERGQEWSAVFFYFLMEPAECDPLLENFINRLALGRATCID